MDLKTSLFTCSALVSGDKFLERGTHSYVARLFRHVCFVYGLFMCSGLVSADGF